MIVKDGCMGGVCATCSGRSSSQAAGQAKSGQGLVVWGRAGQACS